MLGATAADGFVSDHSLENWRSRMKKSLVTAALLCAGIGAGSVATADASTMSHGKLVGFSHKAGSKFSRLKVVHGGKKSVYRVVAKSSCGVSMGQMGDEIRCKTLGKAKYDNKPVRVTWHHDAAGHRVADVVAVDLS